MTAVVKRNAYDSSFSHVFSLPPPQICKSLNSQDHHRVQTSVTLLYLLANLFFFLVPNRNCNSPTMPLQRLVMGSDYSERLIDPLRQKSTRNPPLAILTSSNRRVKAAITFPMFPRSFLRLPARNLNPQGPSLLSRESSPTRLASYGHFHPGYDHFHPGLNLKPKSRKFADFSADEEVIMGRGVYTSLASQYPRRHVFPSNIYVNDLNFILPARLISQQAGQPTNKSNPEDANTCSILQHPATGNTEHHSTSSTRQHSTILPASTQLPNGSEPNASPVTKWLQAVVSVGTQGSCHG